jgi:hypothetical protein
MFFKLLILAVMIVVLRPILGLLVRLLLRTFFRGWLERVGERAMAQQPDQIHLTPCADHNWLDAGAVQALAAPLAARGFHEAGTYTIQEMEGVGVRFLIEPEERIVACVYEHFRAGTWVDLVCSRRDGTGITYSTLRPTGLASRPGILKVNAPELGSEALYQRLLRERPEGDWEEWTAANAPAKFEDAYARETAWRRNKGVSAEEVARQIPQMAGAGACSSSD